jgi:hypothetical protein
MTHVIANILSSSRLHETFGSHSIERAEQSRDGENVTGSLSVDVIRIIHIPNSDLDLLRLIREGKADIDG